MGRGGRRKTGSQDWTQEGLMASETGLFVLLHVPDSHPLQGWEKSIIIKFYEAKDMSDHFHGPTVTQHPILLSF